MKRVKLDRKCPNPLFVKWLEEWREEASSRGSDMQYCFSKALKTMKLCPLPLKRGRDCIVLQNFGKKLCQMLDKKLEEHESSIVEGRGNAIEKGKAKYDGDDSDDSLIDYQNDRNAGNVDKVERNSAKAFDSEGGKEGNGIEPPRKKVKTPKGKRNVKENRANDGRRRNFPSGSYIPAWRSGGYAILLTLYEKTLEPGYVGYMGKADLQREAQKYSDKSLTKAEPGNRYTAWSSMSILIEKGLVTKKKSPAQYRLTDAGFAVALQLSEVDEDHLDLGLPSETKSSASGASYSGFENPFRDLSEPRDKEEINYQFSGSKSSSNVMETVDELPPRDIENLKINEQLKNGGKNIETSSESASQDSASSNFNYNLVLHPKKFNVVLIIDDRETAGGKSRSKDDATIAELTRTGIKFEIKNLKIGDFLWVARSNNSDEELVLPYIVERKRIDDFASSIKDGRYYEQKFRLKKSGIQNVTYLVENHGNNQYSGLPLTTLFQAAINTLVQDGFTVKWTESHKDSMLYLASMTHMLSKIYQDKTLLASKRDDLTKSDVLNDFVKLMYFKEFNKSAAKVKTFKSKEMFIRQLIQLRGISAEKALAIVDFYPTPLALKKAYDENDGKKEGENLLAGIQYGNNKRQIGKAISKTLYQFYTRKDF